MYQDVIELLNKRTVKSFFCWVDFRYHVDGYGGLNALFAMFPHSTNALCFVFKSSLAGVVLVALFFEFFDSLSEAASSSVLSDGVCLFPIVFKVIFTGYDVGLFPLAVRTWIVISTTHRCSNYIVFLHVIVGF